MKRNITVYFLSILTALSAISCASRAESVLTGAARSNVSTSVSPSPATLVSATASENSPLSEKGANTPLASPSSANKKLSYKAKDSASTVYFINRRSGWVLINDALYRTSDAGKSWVKLNSRTLRNYKKIIFTNEQKGFAVRDDWNTGKRSNTVLITEDGGRSWRGALELPTPIYTVDFITEQSGYVHGRWQPIRYTSDGGRRWSSLDGTEGLNYLLFVGETEGWGYGGAIWHTEDGAKTWVQVIPYEKVHDLWDAKFNNGSAWIIGAGRQLWNTTDGKSWEPSTTIPISKSEFTAFDFISSSEGWIASEDGTVIRTSDGGKTWQVVANVENSLRTMKFIDALHGWAATSQGKLLRTTDGGTNWVIVQL